MKTIISLLILLSFAYLLSGCSAYDKWTENETMVDPDSGKVVNKKEIRSSERVDIANDNKQVEITKNAKIDVTNENGEGYVVNKDGKFMGVLYNPHPRLVQDVLLTDPDGEVIANESLQPKEFREVYAQRGSGEDFHLLATWTLGVHQQTVKVLFPKGTAKTRDLRNKWCHFKSHGFGAKGF